MSKLALAAVIVLVSPLLAACPLGGETNETCSVESRNNTTIAISCEDNRGNRTHDEKVNVPLDQYPNCIAGTFWPACKDAVS